mgnify:FL=1
MLAHTLKRSKGFSLLELLVVIAIIGALTTIGVVAYNGYIDSAKAKEAQNGLQSIYMQQEEYKAIYKQFYRPSGGCGDQTSTINTGLFNGQQSLTNDNFRFCITISGTGYIAYAHNKTSGGTSYWIRNTNQKSW